MPDRFHIARDGTLRKGVAGDKDVAVELAPDGGTHEVTVPPQRARTVCLDDRQLSELVDLARRCEQVFAGPRDLEWAIARDRLYLLQCRAVTRAPSLSR
jgi:pyruvate,water dikinase